MSRFGQGSSKGSSKGSSMGSRKVSGIAAVAVAMALSLVVADQADARQGGSFGSRGTRTYTTPAPTQTAPSTAAPIQRSTTPQPGPQAANPSAGAQAAARPSMFGNGFGGALMRGLLIGGLVGMLFGGGLGGMAGILGLLLQVALVGGVIYLVMRLLRGRSTTPAAAGYGRSMTGGPVPGGPNGGPANNGSMSGGPMSGRPMSGGPLSGLGLGRGLGGGMAGGPVPPQPSPASPARGGKTDEIGILPADLDTFERLLATVQTAFSREDQGELKANTTPEMFGFLADELRDNAEKGLRNQVSDVQLLQGDVAEAWREGSRDYATVAIRYAIKDQMVDRATGRVVSGNAGVGETTELWTFVRERGPFGTGPWLLSAIQET